MPTRSNWKAEAFMRTMRRDRAATMLAMACWPIFFACQHDPYTWEYATRQPGVSDLLGAWVATEKTLQDLAAGPFAAHRPSIEVRVDGTIVLRDIPAESLAITSEMGGEQVVNLSASWRLVQIRNKWWSLDLANPDWSCSACIMILGNSPPHSLVIRYGDPDQGLGYEFRKAA